MKKLNIKNLSHDQKRWVSLALALVIYAVITALTGCSERADVDAGKGDLTKEVLQQCGATSSPDCVHEIRKPGQSGFKKF